MRFRTALTLISMILVLNLAPAEAAVRNSVWPLTGPWLRLPAIPDPNWVPGHRGLDIAGAVGQQVRSPVAGRVVWQGEVAGEAGITIRDGLGRRHSLMPVVAEVDLDDYVGRGEIVGKLADSDHCLRACLHWGVKEDGKYLDPRWTLPPAIFRLPNHARG